MVIPPTLSVIAQLKIADAAAKAWFATIGAQ
jgi:hypothetical protein